MTAMTVTLVMAAGPGFPEGSPEHRYVLQMVLDAEGHPDPAAWAGDTAPWRARRIRPEEPEIAGDVQYDEDDGWSLRFAAAAADRPDAPATHLALHEPILRPGAYVTVTEAEEEPRDYRVVGVEPAA